MAKPAQKTQETTEPRREHWLEAPVLVRQRIKSWLVESNAGRLSPASALRDIFGCGYDVRFDEIPQPLTQALESTSDTEQRIAIAKKFPSTQAFAEKQAVIVWNNASNWRLTSLADERASKQTTTGAAQLEARIQARAAEILEERRKAEHASAVEQARRELTGA